MPASDDPIKDREIFLKLMTMDHAGLQQRKSKSIPGKQLAVELQTLPPSVRKHFLDPDAPDSLRSGLSREERDELQSLVFDRLPYAEKLRFCDRPEQIDGPAPAAWAEINAHLGTHANSLSELVEELGIKRFGHRPRWVTPFAAAAQCPLKRRVGL